MTYLLVVVMCSALLNGCSSKPKTSINVESTVVTAEFQDDGSILIKTEELTSDVAFIDVKTKDTSMQFIARKGEDGSFVSDDAIIIPAQTIESMKPLFSNWKQGI